MASGITLMLRQTLFLDGASQPSLSFRLEMPQRIYRSPGISEVGATDAKNLDTLGPPLLDTASQLTGLGGRVSFETLETWRLGRPFAHCFLNQRVEDGLASSHL